MSGSRGQGGMEFLMTYGWAVLAIFIVGIMLWQLGFIGYKHSSITSTGFKRVKPQLASTGFTPDGVFNGMFMNGAGKDIVVTAVVVRNGYDNSILCCTNQLFIPSGETAPCGKDSASDIGGYNFAMFYAGADPQGRGIGPHVSAGDLFKMELGRFTGGGAGSCATPADSCMISGLRSGDSYHLKVDVYYDMTLDEITVSLIDHGGIHGVVE